jgi:condensin complex subunit 1
MDEEMGLAGAAAEDAESEYIRKICEGDLVNGENFLAILQPVLVTICNNPKKYCDPDLQTAATLALAKFMLVR